MVSWSGGESTEDFDVQFIVSYDSPIKISATIDDPLYTGATKDLGLMCEHGKPGKKCVAFVGRSTGRRFIACAVELQKTYEKLVEDVSNLLDSQDNLPQVNHQNDGNSIRNMKHNHLKEKEKMSTDNRTLNWCWTDLKKEKEKLDVCITKLMKEKNKWSIEKSAMECCIADLKKACENNKRKPKEIKGISDEE
ncbi:hypothetical protein D1007_60375 [Hordeum vulgare]|nr:hypothetical protein D1007_60375 [Hordeum vulgare]